jgi:hypothetical protein
MKGRLMKNDLEGTWKEELLVSFWNSYGIYVE